MASNNPQHLLVTAASLLSEHGENPEYDRAIVELTTELLGHSITDYRDDVHRTLRALNPITDPATGEVQEAWL